MNNTKIINSKIEFENLENLVNDASKLIAPEVISDDPVYANFVREHNLVDTSFANFYLGISKDNYSNEEYEFIYTEMLRDMIDFQLFSQKKYDYAAPITPVQKQQISELNSNDFSFKINKEDGFLNLYYQNEEACSSLSAFLNIEALNENMSGQDGDYSFYAESPIYLSSDFIISVLNGLDIKATFSVQS